MRGRDAGFSFTELSSQPQRLGRYDLLTSFSSISQLWGRLPSIFLLFWKIQSWEVLKLLSDFPWKTLTFYKDSWGMASEHAGFGAGKLPTRTEFTLRRRLPEVTLH